MTTIVRPWQPGEPLPAIEQPAGGHLAGEAGSEAASPPASGPAEFCDRCGEWVAAGSTRPYEPRSPYRICAACLTASQDALQDGAHEIPPAYVEAGFADQPPTIQRLWDGDR